MANFSVQTLFAGKSGNIKVLRKETEGEDLCQNTAVPLLGGSSMNENVLRGSRVLVSYDDAVSLGSDIVGGKGWNLGRLHHYGFRVPDGGILVAEIYRQLMRRPELSELTAELANVRSSACTESNVEDILHTLRARIEAATLSTDVEHAIQTFLLDSGRAHLPLAVRSSATIEDRASFSFAGIHESFLNVEGTK